MQAYPAGVRQKTERMLHTCNAASPAATSSLPIGRYILEQFAEITSHHG